MIHLKSQREIDLMRESADLVGRTLAEVARYIHPGVTTAKLDTVADEFIRAHDATPAFKGYQVGQLVFPSTLCTSVNDVVVHGIPDERPLQNGDLVSIDCGVLLNGYYGDFAYTFAVGELSQENRDLCAATHASLYRGIEQAVTGRRVGDISYAIQSYCEERGYGVVRDLVGHGIGKGLHEDPQIPNFGRRGTGRRLRSGLTICIEPMINRGSWEVKSDSDGWTIRAADGLPSAHYEHMVVVQGGRPEILSSFEYIEEIVEAPYREELTHG